MPSVPAASGGAGSKPARRCSSKHSAVVSLPVIEATKVGGHATRIKRSRAGRWRFWVLLTVQLVIAGHIVAWYLIKQRDGVSATLSPVEPSESMYTIETGVVNAGFLFFAGAILLTLLLGRFFCGWGCHIVALQDLCGWVMMKLGVRPRPFRSRLLAYVPVAMALYMFVWPTVKREVVKPLAGEAWPRVAVWLGDAPRWPGWSSGLVVEEFWRTFPPWYVAIPFLAVCGFAAVYFLGNKGFCTYACPYGGFFGPADKLALGKIRVTDACEQCGHCTAVCTSNVRVHEEVRDFGMVVDPGCMKCLDCVSVCPNEALYFGLGKPAILARPRDEAARARRKAKASNADLRWPGEVAAAVLFTVLFIAFRGFLDSVPMLMALALAGIGVFAAWKLWTLVREPNVRVQSVQLKYRGRVRPVAAVFAVLSLGYLATAGWSAVVKYNLWRGGLLDDTIAVSHDDAFRAGFQADPETRGRAERAIAFYTAAGAPGDRDGPGGVGWSLQPNTLVRLAYLSMVCSRPREAGEYLSEALARGGWSDSLLADLGAIKGLLGESGAAVDAFLAESLRAHPDLPGTRRALAERLVAAGRGDEAIKLYEVALAQLPWDPRSRLDAAGVYFALGRGDRVGPLLEDAAAIALKRRGQADVLYQIALAMIQVGKGPRAETLLREATRRSPAMVMAWHDLAMTRALLGRGEGAIEAMKEAANRAPEEPVFAQQLSELLEAAGHSAEAAAWRAKAQELQAKRDGAQAVRPGAQGPPN